MRIVTLTAGVLAIAAAFAVGRASVSAVSPASAQPAMAVTTFSHFECYSSKIQKQVSVEVDLRDQFQEYRTKTGLSDLFCTPVVKKLIGVRPLSVPPPADHLTCYHIQGPAIQQQRPIANQLEKTNVAVGTPTYLCVPTHKTG